MSLLSSDTEVIVRCRGCGCYALADVEFHVRERFV